MADTILTNQADHSRVSEGKSSLGKDGNLGDLSEDLKGGRKTPWPLISFGEKFNFGLKYSPQFSVFRLGQGALSI